MNNQEITQADKLRCPRCQLSHLKRNGRTYYGKQNYQCKMCNRQFVIRNETVSCEKRELIKSLLLERISLRGMCRVLKVSLHDFNEVRDFKRSVRVFPGLWDYQPKSGNDQVGSATGKAVAKPERKSTDG